jgi:hypothetical protein
MEYGVEFVAHLVSIGALEDQKTTTATKRRDPRITDPPLGDMVHLVSVIATLA